MTGVQIVNAIGECEAEARGPMAFLVTIAQVARFANKFFEWLKLRHSVSVSCESIKQIQALRFLSRHFEFQRKRFCGTAGVPPAQVTLTITFSACVCCTQAGGAPAVPEKRLRVHS